MKFYLCELFSTTVGITMMCFHFFPQHCAPTTYWNVAVGAMLVVVALASMLYRK